MIVKTFNRSTQKGRCARLRYVHPGNSNIHEHNQLSHTITSTGLWLKSPGGIDVTIRYTLIFLKNMKTLMRKLYHPESS